MYNGPGGDRHLTIERLMEILMPESSIQNPGLSAERRTPARFAHKPSGSDRGKTLKTWIFWNLLTALLILLFVSAPPIWAEESTDPLPDISHFKYYDEITDKLSLRDALRVLIHRAQLGDCFAAGHLASFLRARKMTDLEGRDDRYWYLFAARCGHVPSMIEIGYPKKYSTTTIVPCGGNKLEIVTQCEPLERETGFPVCKRQILSFFDEHNRLLKKRIAINKLTRNEDRVIISYGACISQEERVYYVVGATNYGGSCCTWDDVFDLTGKYLGSNNDRTSFQVKRKRLSKQAENDIFSTYFFEWEAKRIKIDEYPKF